MRLAAENWQRRRALNEMTDRGSKLYKPALLMLAVLLLVSVSFSHRTLNDARSEMGLVYDSDLGDAAPPMLVFTTVALGGFRGLIANVLWVRASDLQEEERFFEMVQLADWITKLQPHIASVWINQAWNMAYNISVKFTDARDRWQWVQRGTELLRDEALRYNPDEPLIFRELAWFFQHKMGANLDDAHNYYKEQWAKQMQEIFGADGRPNFDELLNPTTDEAKERVRLLRERYKMDPKWIKEVDDRYGPLEWRLPETHAIYWAVLGLETTSDEKLKKDDLVQLRRVIFQSMQLAFHRGRIFPRTVEDRLVYGPNLEIIPRANQAYLDMMEAEPAQAETIRTGHKNFLKSAVYFLYTHNRRKEAQKWFEVMQETYPSTEHPDVPPPHVSVDQFAIERVTEDISGTSHDRVKMTIMGLLVDSFVSLALGDEDKAVGMNLYAQRIHNYYQSQVKGTASQERIGMEPFQVLRNEVINQLLDPESGLVPEVAARLRTELGLPATVEALPLNQQGGTNAPPGRATNAPPPNAEAPGSVSPQG